LNFIADSSYGNWVACKMWGILIILQNINSADNIKITTLLNCFTFGPVL